MKHIGKISVLTAKKSIVFKGAAERSVKGAVIKNDCMVVDFNCYLGGVIIGYCIAAMMVCSSGKRRKNND